MKVFRDTGRNEDRNWRFRYQKWVFDKDVLYVRLGSNPGVNGGFHMPETLYRTAKRLRVSRKKISLWMQMFLKGIKDLRLGGLVKIYHDVPAKDQIELPCEWIFGGQKVEAPEGNHASYFLVDLVSVFHFSPSHFREITNQEGFWH